MTITAAQQQDLYKLAVGLYDAAPGTLYLNALADSLASGASIVQLYDTLANHALFRGQAPGYGAAASDAQFVHQFVENLVGGSALQTDVDAIAAYLTTLLPALTRGALMKLAIDALDAVDEGDATWGDAAALLHNRIEAAHHYTEVLQGSDTDLATLQGKIAGVTSDDASVTAVNRANANNDGYSDTSAGGAVDPPAEPELSDAAAQPAAPSASDVVSDLADDVEPDIATPAVVTPESDDEPAAAAAVVSAIPHDDTVTVADHSVMSLNSRADAEAADLTINSYLNYDHINVDDVTDRLSLAELRAGEEALNGGDTPQACNIAQFNFSLGGGSDTVGYHNETARITAIVGFNADDDTQYVMIDGDNSGNYDDTIADRVDRLVDVENVVASQGDSILDLTNSTMDLAITYSREIEAINGFDQHRVQLANLNTDVAFGMNFLEYRDNNVPDATPDIFAIWNTIEGSDFNEQVELTDAETAFDHNFHLRGGDNEVNYNELTRSINATVNVFDFDPADPAGTGQIRVDVTFTDGNNVIIGEQDVITSYSAQNLIFDPNGDGVGDSSVRIEASQDAEDSVGFAAGLTKLYILGETVDGSDQITVLVGERATQDSIVLTGFELLRDATSNDVYTMEDLQRVINNLTLADNPVDDADTILVFDDAIGFQAAPADTISLEVLNDEFAFDFDVLDVTQVDTGGDDNLLIVGDTDAARDLNDAVRVGSLDLIDDVSLFPTIIFTDASIASSGDEFNIDVAAGEFQDGSGDALFTFDPTLFVFDFSDVDGDTNLTITVDDPAALGVVVITDGQDTVTGGAGNDTIIGGAGPDTLDGGIGTETRTIQLDGILDVAANTVTLTMGTGGVVLTINESAAPADLDPTDLTLDILQGSGSIAVGNALLQLVNANLADINAVVGAFSDQATGTIDVPLTGASFDPTTGLLTFTFQAGTDVDVADLILAADTDGGTYAASTDTTVQEGGDGGSDTFVYNDAGESTLTSMDQLPTFTIDGATGNNDVIDLSALAIGDTDVANDNGAADFDDAQDLADGYFNGDWEVVAISDGTNAWAFVDANNNNELDNGDMVIGLTGVTDVSGFDNNNVNF